MFPKGQPLWGPPLPSPMSSVFVPVKWLEGYYTTKHKVRTVLTLPVQSDDWNSKHKSYTFSLGHHQIGFIVYKIRLNRGYSSVREHMLSVCKTVVQSPAPK